jgi:hypothetical protein
MALTCASSRRTSASEDAPGAGRNAAGTGWAGATWRDACVRARVTAVVCTVTVWERASGEVFGWAADVALCGAGTSAVGVEPAQPAISVAVRRSTTTVAPAAQFGCLDPHIHRLWGKAADQPPSGQDGSVVSPASAGQAGIASCAMSDWTARPIQLAVSRVIH